MIGRLRHDASRASQRLHASRGQALRRPALEPDPQCCASQEAAIAVARIQRSASRVAAGSVWRILLGVGYGRGLPTTTEVVPRGLHEERPAQQLDEADKARAGEGLPRALQLIQVLDGLKGGAGRRHGDKG